MGIATIIKNYLIATYPEAFMTPQMVNDENIQTPEIVIIDFTYVTKFSQDFQTGSEFYYRQLIPQFEKFFKSGAKMVFLVFDTKSPPNKYEEHEKRYGNLVKTPTPTTPREVMDICNSKASDFFQKRAESFVAHEMKNPNSFRESENYSIEDATKALEDRNSPRYDELLCKLSTADPAVLLVFTDEVYPSKLRLKTVMSNSQLRREFMHYISQKMLFDESDAKTLFSSGVHMKKFSLNRERGYVPPPNCVLCIHGAQATKPQRDGSYASADNHLFVINNAVVSPRENPNALYDFERFETATTTTTTREFNFNGSSSFPKTKRTIFKADADHPPEILKNLGEGELSCTYYSLKHMSDNQLIVTGDGDLIPICLLASRYRMNPAKTNFLNSVFLLLKCREGKTKINKKMTTTSGKPDRTTILKSHSGDLFVNVNELHDKVTKTGPFSKCADPVAVMSLVTILIKSDFVKNFGYGIKGCQSETQTPWMILPFLENPENYRDLVIVTSPEIHVPWYGRPHLEAETSARHSFLFPKKETVNYDKFTPKETELANGLSDKIKRVKVIVDDELFYRYVCHVYVSKYSSTKVVQTAIKRKMDQIKKSMFCTGWRMDSNLELDIKVGCVREHLSKSKLNVMMSKGEILSYSRRVSWVLDYWLNSYRGDCSYMNPTETFEGLSVHGWCKSTSGNFTCRSTAEVSPTYPYRSVFERDAYSKHFESLQNIQKEPHTQSPIQNKDTETNIIIDTNENDCILTNDAKEKNSKIVKEIPKKITLPIPFNNAPNNKNNNDTTHIVATNLDVDTLRNVTSFTSNINPTTNYEIEDPIESFESPTKPIKTRNVRKRKKPEVAKKPTPKVKDLEPKRTLRDEILKEREAWINLEKPQKPATKKLKQ